MQVFWGFFLFLGEKSLFLEVEEGAGVGCCCVVDGGEGLAENVGEGGGDVGEVG